MYGIKQNAGSGEKQLQRYDQKWWTALSEHLDKVMNIITALEQNKNHSTESGLLKVIILVFQKL